METKKRYVMYEDLDDVAESAPPAMFYKDLSIGQSFLFVDERPSAEKVGSLPPGKGPYIKVRRWTFRDPTDVFEYEALSMERVIPVKPDQGPKP